MANLETEFTLQELEYLKEKTEMCRSAGILMKTITAVIIFTGVLAIIGVFAAIVLLL